MLALTLTLLVAANPEALAVSPEPAAALEATVVMPAPPVVPLETPRRDKVRLSKKERAAKLLTAEERAEFARLGQAIEQNSRPMGSKALLGASIGVMTLGLAVPTVIGVIGVGVTAFVGFFGIFEALAGGTSLFRAIGTIWASLVAIVPIWGWIAIAAVTAVGTGMLIAAEVADGPRRAKGRAFKQQQNALLKTALMREQAPTTLVPVLSF